MWEKFTNSAIARRMISRLFAFLTCLLGLFLFDLSLFDTNSLARLIEILAAICLLLSGSIRLWLTRKQRRFLDSPY